MPWRKGLKEKGTTQVAVDDGVGEWIVLDTVSGDAYYERTGPKVLALEHLWGDGCGFSATR